MIDRAILIVVSTLSFLFPWPASANVQDSRYGPLALFDSRSMYGKGFFPEPFLIDDSDLEVNEVRFDWFHQEAAGQTGNSFRGEFEKGFGLLTVEVEVPYVYDTQRSFDRMLGRSVQTRSHGFDNVSVGVRNPVFQYVSQDEFFDTTFGLGLEVGLPTNTPVSKNAEVVPKLFNDLRVGDHLTLQTIIGHSSLYGSKPDGGTETFEYGLVIGWSIAHDQLPIPDVEQLVPVLEVKGERLLNTAAAGSNTLLGDAAFRLNLRSIGPVQPRLGLGYVFPLDKGGHDELRWGIYTSLVFEF